MAFQECAGCGNAINMDETSTDDKIYFVAHESNVSGYSTLRAALYSLRNWTLADKTYWCTDCVDLGGED